MELKEGQVYKRIKGPNVTFTEGNHYPVKIDENNVPFILSDRGARWYSREIMDECFELVQDNKEEKETIKKGDIVEVIKGDFSALIRYEAGTTWKVQDVSNLFVTVYDGRQSDCTGILYKDRVKKLEAPEAPDHEEAPQEPVPDPEQGVKPVLISVENLMNDIVEKGWTDNEILAYLTGYLKGGRAHGEA